MYVLSNDVIKRILLNNLGQKHYKEEIVRLFLKSCETSK